MLSLIWKSSYLIALLFKLVEQTKNWVCSFHPPTICLIVFSICTAQLCVWLQRLETIGTHHQMQLYWRTLQLLASGTQTQSIARVNFAGKEELKLFGLHKEQKVTFGCILQRSRENRLWSVWVQNYFCQNLFLLQKNLTLQGTELVGVGQLAQHCRTQVSKWPLSDLVN